jgi:hypothetical protein
VQWRPFSSRSLAAAAESFFSGASLVSTVTDEGQQHLRREWGCGARAKRGLSHEVKKCLFFHRLPAADSSAPHFATRQGHRPPLQAQLLRAVQEKTYKLRMAAAVVLRCRISVMPAIIAGEQPISVTTGLLVNGDFRQPWTNLRLCAHRPQRFSFKA